MRLSVLEIAILDVLVDIYSTTDFDWIITSIGESGNQDAIDEMNRSITASLEHMLGEGLILEPHEWHYKITDAGRAAHAWETLEVDVDPVMLIYAGFQAA